MLKLYYATGTCALATYITLEEAGADYAAERLSFKTNQQNSAEYLAINPKGRVPALVTWGGWQAIDRHETAAGEPHGRPRVKFVRVPEMLEVAAAR